MKKPRALVCGASEGIGRATAIALSQRGFSVSLLARNRSRLEVLASTLPDAEVVVADLDAREALAEILATACKKGPYAALVNNTGGPKGGPLLATTEATWMDAFGRTVLASQVLVNAVLPGMKALGHGRIVNVLSTSVREPIATLGVGNTVRAAMAGWSKTLASELPPGITINNVLPGYTRTDRLDELAEANAQRTGRDKATVLKEWAQMTPEGRIAEPEEIANVIAFLCSAEASFMRGQSIAVDGGRLRSI